MCRGVNRIPKVITMLRTLKQVKNLKGKRVLLRVDFNVPVDFKGKISDDTRIRETIPTISYLLKKKARVIVISHMGRPDGKVAAGLRMNAMARKLAALLKKPVKKLDDCIGPDVESAINKMKDGSVIMLENIRFHPGEEKNDPAFAKKLAKLGDIFVNDAFAVSHRAHASTSGIAKYIPAYAGLLVESEIKHLTPLLKKAKKPFALLVGGAKVDTKLGLLKNYIGKADYILVGGALANTFLAAQGFDVAASKYEKDMLGVAQEILMLAEKKKTQFILPQDAIVADEMTARASILDLPLEDIEGSMKILDIGTKTRRHYLLILKKARTILWNGPMGLYEMPPFAGGTRYLAQAIGALGIKTKTYLGGGDTIDAIARSKVPVKKFTFVSTGGGAMLEFLEGKKLPGISVLIR